MGFGKNRCVRALIAKSNIRLSLITNLTYNYTILEDNLEEAINYLFENSEDPCKIYIIKQILKIRPNTI